MRSPLLRALALAATLSFAAGGCSDTVAPDAAPSAPDAAGPSHGLLSDLLLVDVLQRTRPLGRDYAASAVIGTGGGTLRIPEAGFAITFPAGAVRTPVTVRATALAGSNVAYRFEPHGLVFQKEPVIAQDLGLTEALTRLLFRQLEGGYVPDESTLGGGTAVVSETRPASVDLLRLRMTFTIRHFSAYVASSGRKGGYITASGDRVPTSRPRL
jgi:hypothetical protein